MRSALALVMRITMCLGSESGGDLDLNCGSYALWVASCRVGQVVDLEEVGRVVSLDEQNGTTLLSLKRGAEALGLYTQGYLVKTADELARVPVPAILPVRRRDSRGELVPHFIVLWDVRGNRVRVVDPPNPAEVWSYRHLRHVWDGPALSISKADSFPVPEPPWMRTWAWISCGLVVVLAAACLWLLWRPARPDPARASSSAWE